MLNKSSIKGGGSTKLNLYLAFTAHSVVFFFLADSMMCSSITSLWKRSCKP